MEVSPMIPLQNQVRRIHGLMNLIVAFSEKHTAHVIMKFMTGHSPSNASAVLESLKTFLHQNTIVEPILQRVRSTPWTKPFASQKQKNDAQLSSNQTQPTRLFFSHLNTE
jgi:hypothetical protein